LITTYHKGDQNQTGSRAPQPPAPEEKRTAAAATTVLDHPIARHALAALRHRQTGAPDFQAHCRQLLLLLALEATRTLPTAAGEHGDRLPARPVVFITVTRPALGLAAAVVDFVPGVAVGSISLDAARAGDQPEARLHVFHAPALNQVRVLLFAPVVATGLSATAALQLLRQSGARDVALLSFVISGQGLARIRRGFADVPVWTGAVDHEWDAKLGPLPGIWDFSGRICG
jgi:uracil phosphoribosyltransferase